MQMSVRFLVLAVALLAACDAKDDAKPSGVKLEGKGSEADADAKAIIAAGNQASPAADDSGIVLGEETLATFAAYDGAATRPAAAAPATTKDASKQMDQWLSDPVKSPVPALLGASGEIELVVHCGACESKPAPTITKSSGAAAFGKRVRELVDPRVGGGEPWDVGNQEKCDEHCCSYLRYADPGSGHMSLEKVCVALGTDGKPTAYTRIDASRL